MLGQRGENYFIAGLRRACGNKGAQGVTAKLARGTKMSGDAQIIGACKKLAVRGKGGSGS